MIKTRKKLNYEKAAFVVWTMGVVAFVLTNAIIKIYYVMGA